MTVINFDEEAKDRDARIAAAKAMFSGARPLDFSADNLKTATNENVAERYLIGRIRPILVGEGPFEAPEIFKQIKNLYWHPKPEHPLNNSPRDGGILAKLTDKNDQHTGTHATFIYGCDSHPNVTKRTGDAKVTRGVCKSAGVELIRGFSDTLIVGEGIETMLSIASIQPLDPDMLSMSEATIVAACGGLSNWCLSDLMRANIDKVIVAIDNDKAGWNKAAAVSKTLFAQNKKVWFALAPYEGEDWNYTLAYVPDGALPELRDIWKRSQVKQYSVGGGAPKATDAAIGVEVARALQNDYLWIDGQTWVFNTNQNVWKKCRKLDMLRRCLAAMNEMRKSDFESVPISAYNGSRQVNIITNACETAYIKRDIVKFDWDPLMINGPKSATDLRTGMSRASDRMQYFTRCLAVQPASIATDDERSINERSMFMSLLKLWSGDDQEYFQYIRMMLGYLLLGRKEERKFFIVEGPGGNGKSTIFGAIADLMGSYARTGPASLITETHHEAHPTDLAGIEGYRLVVCHELGKSKRFSEERVKALTGGDTMTARGMREDFHDFRPVAQIVALTNSPPAINQPDDAWAHRIAILPMAERPDRVEPDFRARMVETEGAAILGFMVACAIEYLDRRRAGETPLNMYPSVVADRTNEYLGRQDWCRRWIKDRCVVGEGLSASIDELHADLVQWASDTHISRDALSRALTRAGFKLHRTKSERRRIGLALKNGFDPDELDI